MKDYRLRIGMRFVQQRRLPRAMWSCHHFLNPHSRHSPTELFALNLIPISE